MSREKEGKIPQTKYWINNGNEKYAHVWYSNGQLNIKKFGKKTVFQIDENALPHLMAILIGSITDQTHTTHSTW